MKKINEFELKPDLFINNDNYSELIKMYKLALKKNKKNFPFRNKKGKVYAIETDYVTFIINGGANFSGLNNLNKKEQKDLELKSKQYKKDEERLTKEELEKKQNEILAKELSKDDNSVFTFDSNINK
tara:strand:- start:7332 stop:7712 length:381 start_codon:yes stop_codon:yes gene_type:complete